MPKKAKKAKEIKEGCQYCGKSFSALPFKCKFCGLNFCAGHRLPEDHGCVGLEARKGRIKEKLARGEKITYTYEPRVRKEIKMKYEEPGVSPTEQVRKNITDPLLKSPMAIIGLIVAVVAIIGFLLILLL